MVRLRIQLLGTFQVSLDGAPLTHFGADTARALLAYLAMNAGKYVPREIAASLLWPERDEARALHNLRQALTRLRSALGEQEAQQPFLQVTRETLCFCPQSPYWLDVAAFEERLAAVRDHPHRDLASCPSCVQQLEEAAALYGGSFLEGFYIDSIPFEEWLVVERERLHRLAMDLFYSLAETHQQRAAYDRAREYARRQIDLEPWREEAHQQLMRIMALSGQRSAAMAQYETCRRILADELGAEPSAETTALYEAIKGGSFPPPPAPVRPLHNLPAPATPFIGRRDELASLTEKLLDPHYRLLTLTGMGGVGKTRLALAAAEQIADRFPGGVWFVPLYEVETARAEKAQRRSLLILAVAQALGLALSSAQDAEVPLFDFLRNQQMLLLLDNVDPWFEEVTDLVLHILQNAPGVTFLVTSRERLNLQAEYVMRLDGLPVPDVADPGAPDFSSVQLFRERAERTSPGFALNATTLPAVIQICRFVEGLPLAIELAAALVENMPVAEVAGAIQRDALRLATTMRDVPPRQRSIRAVFESSWQSLSAREQAVLAQLSVFRGSFELDAAQAVAGAAPSDLQALLDKSLLCVDEAERYTIHNLVRQLAEDKLQSDCALETVDGRTASIAIPCLRHSEYYLGLVAAHTPALYGHSPQLALAEIERNWENIHQAWYWAATVRRIDLLARSVDALQRFLLLKGRSQWGKLLFGMAIERPELFEQFGGPTLRLRLLLGIARFLSEEGHYVQAAAVAQEALTLARRYQLPHMEAAATMELGAALREQGQYIEAQAMLNRALLQARALHSLDVVARSLNWLGDLAGQQHDDQRAREVLEEALRLTHELDDALQEASLLNSLGRIATKEGYFDRAMAYLDEALRTFHALGSLHGESMTLHSLGVAWQALGDYATARACYEQSLCFARELGLHRGEVEVLTSLTSLLTEQGNEHAAAAIGRQAVDMARSLADRAAEGRALLCWGHALAALGAWDEATRAYEQVLALRRALGQGGVSPEVMASLARAALGKGENERAMQWVEEILRQVEEGALAQSAELVRIYWDCHAVLRTCGDLRAAYTLGMARILLRDRAARIYDQEMRRSFLENVPLHRAILSA